MDVTVQGIYVYPIKGMQGIALQEAMVLPKGLENDRRWMLVDDGGNAITQRQLPALAGFEVTMATGNNLLVSYQNKQISIPLLPKGLAMQAWVFEQAVLVTEVAPAISQWFSQQLKTPCRLVHFAEEATRQVDTAYAPVGTHTSLSDGYPVLVTNLASLADLNSRLHEPVPMDRFRPNIVLQTQEPFAEDRWQTLQLPNLLLSLVKPCARCTVTTVNQHTGQRGTEPLATLARFRKQGNKVLFGQNALVIRAGSVRVGQQVTTQ